MRFLLPLLLIAAGAPAETRVVELPSKSPMVTLRIVFTTGSAADPAGKPGLAYLTAMMLANGGTKDLTYRQIVDAMFPMAAGVSAQVDKEMSTFSGETHIDNLSDYYKLLRAMLLEPGWREDDFKRVRDDAVNYLKVGLRGNNDEELAKEVLYQNIYEGTPYGHYSAGTVSSLQAMTLEDVKAFYKSQYTQSHLILGIAGGFSPQFLEGMKKDFASLPAGDGARTKVKPPAAIESTRAVIIDKDTRSVAYSIGLPIDCTRISPDYPALLLATTYFGQHRMSGGVLYDRMREKRGLNYGDYAYLEYFPRGMFLMEPQPNLPRQSQIFQLWIRPVEPPTAVFALRLALYELDKLIRDGIPQDGFDRTREFLTKYVNVLTRTKRAELGYAIDSLYYGVPNYNTLIKTALAKMTREDVNRAIKRYLRTDKLVIVAVSKNAEGLMQKLGRGDASPMEYNSPKAAEITEEDKLVEKWPLGLKADDISIKAVSEVFQ